EAQRHEVLHRFLAEVMIDAEDVALEKDGSDHIVDRRRALAIPADRLLDDDARAGARQPFGAEALRQRTKPVRTGREIIGADAVVVAEQSLEVRPAAIAHRIDRDIVEPGQKSLRRRPRSVVDNAEFHQRLLDRGAERLAVEAPARRADDPGRLGELTAALAVKQRRVELA